MKSRLLNIIACFALVSPLSVNGIYLTMLHSEKKCFYEEIPYETVVLAKYKLEQVVEPTTARTVIFPSVKNFPTDDTGLGLQIEVRDPNDAILLSKTYGKEGRIAVTSHMAGDHSICLTSNDTSLDGTMKVHLDIKTGGHAVDYDLVSKKEKLTALQLQLRKIQDLIQQIQKEQDYQRTREKRFRSTSESTNWRVLFFAFLQTVIFIAVGVYQVKHLKFFFILKKLV